MRALRNCDFCDAEAVGAFEIVPPELDPTEAEQRRVVLCRDCQTRLESLLEPLLARAGVTAESDDTDPESAPSSASSSASSDDPSSGTVDPETPQPTTGIAFGDDDGASEADDVTDSDHSMPGDGDDSSSLLGSASGSDEAETSSVDETAAEAEATGDDKSGESSDQPVSAGESSDSTESDTASSADSVSATRPPQAYAKTIRLLRNREFPMERDDVEELAAGAYDLEPSTATAIVDHALENDEFTERGGTLHRA
ncbi:hypothetical protein ACLI4Z_16980 [Natrialbaceae archaeon A-arb3/5]